MANRLAFVCLLWLGLLAICSMSAQADVIPGITAYSDHGPTPGYNLAHLVNGAGLPGGVPTLDAEHSYPNYGTSWQSYPTVNLTFDLHGEYDVSTMCVWPWSSLASASAKGVRIRLAGRLGGAEMSRKELLRVGSLPLHTIRAKIDYGFAEAATTYGNIGVKVWINHGLLEEGETLDKERERAADAKKG